MSQLENVGFVRDAIRNVLQSDESLLQLIGCSITVQFNFTRR